MSMRVHIKELINIKDMVNKKSARISLLRYIIDFIWNFFERSKNKSMKHTRLKKIPYYIFTRFFKNKYKNIWWKFFF